MSDSISLSQLESHLWEAANILRGPVDAADFKTYVFPLLFFKRISDVYDEEYAAALAESGGDEEYAQFPQNYRFQIPKECHWNDVRVVATNDDEKIQRHEAATVGGSRSLKAARNLQSQQKETRPEERSAVKTGLIVSDPAAGPRSGANKPGYIEPVRTILKKSEGCLRHQSCCPDQNWSTGKRW